MAENAKNSDLHVTGSLEHIEARLDKLEQREEKREERLRKVERWQAGVIMVVISLMAVMQIASSVVAWLK